MQFRTQIPIPKSNFPIDYTSRIVSLGSCFAENIGLKFDYGKFQHFTNPFGVIFNIISIEKLLERSVHQRYFTENDIFFLNERWHCYEVHSALSHSDKKVFLDTLNEQLEALRQNLIQATHIIITLGTSWVYKQLASGAIVANCHKVSQKQFEKVLLSPEENQKSIANCITNIGAINAAATVVFTVSPVRHTKDGFVENQRSKAHLISAIHNTANLNYFPSYEIMMDELRDYRFYAEDMLHPNQIAVDYIWERFLQTTISEEAGRLLLEIEAIQKALSHRPFNPDSESHRNFLEKLTKKMLLVQQNFPHITF